MRGQLYGVCRETDPPFRPSSKRYHVKNRSPGDFSILISNAESVLYHCLAIVKTYNHIKYPATKYGTRLYSFRSIRSTPVLGYPYITSMCFGGTTFPSNIEIARPFSRTMRQVEARAQFTPATCERPRRKNRDNLHNSNSRVRTIHCLVVQ